MDVSGTDVDIFHIVVVTVTMPVPMRLCAPVRMGMAGIAKDECHHNIDAQTAGCQYKHDLAVHRLGLPNAIHLRKQKESES